MGFILTSINRPLINVGINRLNPLIVILISFLITTFVYQPVLAEKVDQGMVAPDFSIKRFDGSEFKLSEFKGKKAVYLVFWTTWCTFCIKKIPKLKFFQQTYGKQIEIIGIDTSVRDSLTKAYRFQKEYGINYPLAYDHKKIVTDRYGVWGTPTEFIIDINGIIIHRDGIPDNLSEHLSNWNMVDKMPDTLVQL